MEKTLNFSEPFLNAEYASSIENYPIQDKTIIVNIDSLPVEIEGFLLQPMKSTLFSNSIIKKANSLILITVTDEDFLGLKTTIDEEIIKYSWHHVLDFYNLPHLKKTPLWCSEKQTIGKLELKLSYAPKGTHCGLHHDHPFREIHTQLFGVGSMQKFHENNPKTLYQEVLMSPGYTHDPFYSESGTYPWHQYYAETDCIWLGIEMHE